DYHVDGPRGRFVLRVGQWHAEMDALLVQHQASTWAYLTAHNPRSIAAHPELNLVQHRKLAAEIAQRGWPSFTGAGIATSGDWPAEESLLILGIDLEGAHELASFYDQLAFLFGEHGGPVQLIWTANYNTGDSGNSDNIGNTVKG